MATATTPHYKRTLDSFSDDIITEVKSSDRGLWYAVLDVGEKTYVSDPDFSTCGRTREDAQRDCAKRIRENARGIGKRAPYGLLTPGYDLHFRLMKHWEDKERRIDVLASKCDDNDYQSSPEDFE